jgi:uncharacterized protein YneF (UPF0154 family)
MVNTGIPITNKKMKKGIKKAPPLCYKILPAAIN